MDVNWNEVHKYQEDVESFAKYFCENHEIRTNGAMARPVLSTETIDDGDISVQIKIPYASMNDTWRDSSLNLLQRLRTSDLHKPSSIYLSPDKIVVEYTIHSCDPD